jgi:archaellum biogenesis ATPase FlaH
LADTKSQIQDIAVSERPKKRSTGIVGLNLLLDGGFPIGTTIMIYGTPLAGVDLAASQFWKVDGEEGTYLMNDGDVESGMIDASELHPEMYMTQMAGSRIVVDSLSTIIIKYGIEEALKFLRLAREE